MKSKIPSIIFRILTILTFLCGAVMFVHFIRAMIFAVQHEGAGDDPKFSGILGDIALFVYPFMIMTVLCIIFSIICFKAYHPAVSAIRTIFMAICLILDLISLKVMKAFILMDDLFNKGINKDLDEYREGFDLSESEITFMILPVIAAVIFFIFFISSIVALVKGPKLKQVENTQI